MKNSSPIPHTFCATTLNKQKGAALILFVFFLSLVAVVYIIKAFDTSALQSQQDEKTFRTLSEAKAALIAWSVSHKKTPGQMPWPDRNGDGNYDGSSDCVTTAFQYSYLLGQLPSVPTTSPCIDTNNGLVVYTGFSTYPGLGKAFLDAQGNRLWYAVSRNLVRDYKTSTDPIINPGIINSPNYNWLQVLDRNGNTLSNRVAAVIIAPGQSIGGQDRTGAAPNASEYLDSFNIGAAVYSNRGYATDDEDFIMGEDSRNISVNDPTYQHPYYFNDKLVYITIDELMAALEKRVAAETRAALKAYKASTTYYPYAAIMGGSKNYSCIVGQLAGALPTAVPHSSSCSYTSVTTSISNSSCSFNDISSVKFTRSSSTFSTATGACQASGAKCICTGAGQCNNAANTLHFTCLADGSCNSTTSGSYTFTGGVFDSISGKCTQTPSCGSSDIVCMRGASSGTGNFAHSNCTDAQFNNAATNSALPAWFTTNQWQDYLYYAVQRGASPTLSAGNISAVTALTVTTGRPINTSPFAAKGSAQVRPSCDLTDHMDTTANATGSTTYSYEPIDKQRSQTYNDQVFVISP